MRKIRFSLLLLLLGSQSLRAQVDPHFTQYYVYPSWLNPALTGVFDGDYRVSAIYRTQWGNISSPYSTPGASADVNTSKNINMGISLLRQTAGDGGFAYTTGYANLSYTGVQWNQGNNRLVFGMQVGFIERRFDRSKLTFGDQWNPVTGFNSSNLSAEMLNNPQARSLDIGAGAFYYDARPGKKANFFGGFAASHINRPDDRFGATGNARLPMRFTTHAGARLMVNDVFSITPNALYVRQGTASETMVGAYGQYKTAPQLDLLFGVNYRVKDAISPFAGIYYKNLVVGLTYDANVSELGKLARASNSFELSLTFTGRRSTKTPAAEFICPRL
jgi:type IX secretion system PorP/SprF family membrane protein